MSRLDPAQHQVHPFSSRESARAESRREPRAGESREPARAETRREPRPGESREPRASQAAASSSRMASQAATLTHIGSDFSQMSFGCPDFQWVVAQDTHWLVYCNQHQRHHRRPDESILYHGTTLSQCYDICSSHFDVGRYNPGTPSSPCGIWGTSEPGHSFHRVPLERGWSHNRPEEISMGGWDCPVAFGWAFKTDQITSHKQLATGTVYVHKLPCGTRWNVLERYTEIWVHASMGDRFKVLRDHWHSLVLKQSVACRSRIGHPDDLYKLGRGSMTCARVCPVSQLTNNNWHRANGTGQHRCNFCEISYTHRGGCRPCTDHA